MRHFYLQQDEGHRDQKRGGWKHRFIFPKGYPRTFDKKRHPLQALPGLCIGKAERNAAMSVLLNEIGRERRSTVRESRSEN